MGLSEIFADLSSNPYFGAGFGLIGVGTGLAVAKGAWRNALVVGRRQMLISLEIPSRDRSYNWVLQWMSQQSALGVNMGSVLGFGGGGFKTQHLSVQTTVQQYDTGRVDTRFDFMPSPGRHLLYYKGHIILVQRDREKQMVDLNSGTPWETVTLTALRRKGQTLFNDILEDAKRMAVEREEGKVVIYTNWGMEWRPFGQPRKKRPVSSVILDKGVDTELVKDVREFLDSGSWYLERGIPYRRGYLLYGPPGSGKTSFIQALAGEFQYNICVLNLAEKGLTDDRLIQSQSVLPERSIILLEDVDCVFSERDKNDRYSSQVTFSGLLNTLDGVVSTEQRVVFMTTNHIERLDPALIRPGRVDVSKYIGDASAYQAKKMFLRFYEGLEEKSNEFAEMLTSSGVPVSMAQLQGYLMLHKTNPNRAMADFGHFLSAIAQGQGQHQARLPPLVKDQIPPKAL